MPAVWARGASENIGGTGIFSPLCNLVCCEVEDSENAAVAELVPSEADTSLEPAVPAGTIIVTENDPDKSAVTDGGVVAIEFPSNINAIEWDWIKSEPDIVITVPEFPLDGDSVIAEVVCVNVAVGELSLIHI